MKTQNLFIFFVVSMFLISTASAGVLVQIRETNPGIAGEKPAEIIFDVVNTDMEHKIEGFVSCRSPPGEVMVSSSMGPGSGAQYVSPKFTMDSGPSQKAMSLVIEADTAGDKRTGCSIIYIFYNETETSESIVKKQYWKAVNQEYVDNIQDTDYIEVKINNTVPFVAQDAPCMKDPHCPEGKAICLVSEVQSSMICDYFPPPYIGITFGVAIVLLIVLLIYIIVKILKRIKRKISKR